MYRKKRPDAISHPETETAGDDDDTVAGVFA
jgi:hypothetical protein